MRVVRHGDEADASGQPPPSEHVQAVADDSLDGDRPMLEVTQLRKSYGERVALAGVSLDARRGEMVACIGPNGAGKTTLLSVVAGIQQADAGEVVCRADRIGWVPQQPALYGKLSVAENLRLFARLEGVPDVDVTVTRMLEQTKLQARADQQVMRLSGGNRQRVNIAIGLLASPPVILLDEPSAALDPRQRERLWAFILDLARVGTTVLYSTHNVSEVEHYAQRVLVLADGERLFWGPPQELRETVAGPDRDHGEVTHDDFESAFVAFLHQRGH